MCNYPLVQRNAADEIDKFIISNGRLPKFSERADVPYCVSLLKECMRFRPTTPFGIPHSTTEDSKLLQYLREKKLI